MEGTQWLCPVREVGTSASLEQVKNQLRSGPRKMQPADSGPRRGSRVRTQATLWRGLQPPGAPLSALPGQGAREHSVLPWHSLDLLPSWAALGASEASFLGVEHSLLCEAHSDRTIPVICVSVISAPSTTATALSPLYPDFPENDVARDWGSTWACWVSPEFVFFFSFNLINLCCIITPSQQKPLFHRDRFQPPQPPLLPTSLPVKVTKFKALWAVSINLMFCKILLLITRYLNFTCKC